MSLFFESNLHTLPPHFELKTDQTKELMDHEHLVTLQENIVTLLWLIVVKH